MKDSPLPMNNTPVTPFQRQRRGLMASAGALGALVAGAAKAQVSPPPAPEASAADSLTVPRPLQDPASLARDEAHWARVAALFPVDRSVVNFENGYFGMMGKPVAQAYHRHIDEINRRGSVFVRGQYDAGEAARVRDRVALELGAKPQEVALTRGATEALQNLITNYRRLQPGDVALYADLDYDSMQYAMNYLRQRRGAEVVRISLPEPASHQNVIDAYARAFEQHPKTRLLLLTHVSHRTGLLLPVAEICRLARARGIDVIVDAAHSWGQIDFKVESLGADFVGFNLHKWMGAPLGVGCLYIKEGRLDDIDRAFEDGDYPAHDVRSRVHTGTTNIANVLSVPVALDLHQALGPAHKEARLRHLRDLWVAPLLGLPKLQILTPQDPRLYAGITSIRLRGQTSREDNLRLAKRLKDEFGLFTVRRGGVAAGDCVRISPALFTSAEDTARLVEALKVIAA